MKIDLNDNNIPYTISSNDDGVMTVTFNTKVFGEDAQIQVRDTVVEILKAFDNYVDMVRKNIFSLYSENPGFKDYE